MTRVNLVKPEDLADQHLFAEWREIKMVPAALRRSLKTRSAIGLFAYSPIKYTLNAGHVTFFYPRMKFLTERYCLLTEELLMRDYDIEDKSGDFTPYLHDIPPMFSLAEWEPTRDEIAINIERIVQRLNEKPDWYKYYGSNVKPIYFEELYKLQYDMAI